MANYLTQIKSSNNTYNVKDAEAITGIQINNNGKIIIASVTNGVAEIPLDTVVISQATSGTSGTIKVAATVNGEKTNLSLSSNGTLVADVPLKTLKIRLSSGVYNTISIDDNKAAVIPYASKNSPGIIAPSNQLTVNTNTGVLNLNLGDGKNTFQNVLLESNDLDFTDFANAENKNVRIMSDTVGTRYISSITKEYLFNSLKKFNKEYISSTYAKTSDFEKLLNNLYKNDENKGKTIEEILADIDKISKVIINNLSELPNLSNLTNTEKNTFYIYKSKEEDETIGNYVYTAKKIDNAYKWVCISTPKSEFETEDLDFDTIVSRYNNYSIIQNKSAFKDFTEIKTYLDNKYSNSEKSNYLVNGETIEAVKINLIANGGGLDYVNIDILITSNNYYLYLYEYSEESNKPDLVVSNSDTAITYNGNDISSYLFSVE